MVASSAMESATRRSVVTVSSGRDAGDQDGGDESAGEMSTARAAGGGERSRRGVSTRRRAFGCRRSSFVVDFPGTAETIVCAHQSQRLPPSPSLAVWECLEGSVSPGVARALGRDQGRVASRRWLSPADLPSRLWESFCASDAPLSSTGGSGGGTFCRIPGLPSWLAFLVCLPGLLSWLPTGRFPDCSLASWLLPGLLMACLPGVPCLQLVCCSQACREFD